MSADGDTVRDVLARATLSRGWELPHREHALVALARLEAAAMRTPKLLTKPEWEDADRIAADFAGIPFPDHEARRLALAYQSLRTTVAVYAPVLDKLEAAEAQRDALAEALRVYADARHWGISRDDLSYRVVSWIGPGADKRGLPDAMETARAALAEAGLEPNADASSVEATPTNRERETSGGSA